MVVHHFVATLEDLCLQELKEIVANVSLDTAKLVLRLVPDEAEREDSGPYIEKEVCQL